ncbi:hypothetical protein PFLUV_G00046940 [Perca fluviatilis]|uniref:Uncharacterized protein n=1 Tax=Perca fluviatilis TaxID=8168 RepID=A0A6A5FGB0_PERFL|nr:hypothetical protein PFLUV_G00046940 [Perca fluviatilis]
MRTNHAEASEEARGCSTKGRPEVKEGGREIQRRHETARHSAADAEASLFTPWTSPTIEDTKARGIQSPTVCSV